MSSVHHTGPHVDVSVLVVTYNSAAFIEDCIASVPAAAGPRSTEIVVLDNASSDDSAAAARRRLPTEQVVVETVNHGFARGVNLAADRAVGRYLLLLNPDARLHPGAIDELVSYADGHPRHGCYGGRVVDPDGRLDPKSCWGLPSAWSMTCFATGLSSAFRRSPVFDPTSLGRWPRDTHREVGAVSGCLLLVRRDVWDELGGFDEHFFVYGEDIDLGWRLNEAGYRPVIVPSAVLTHVVAASSTSDLAQTRLLLTARATFLRLRWTGARRRWGLAMLRLGVALRAVGERIRGRSASGRWTELHRERETWSAGFARREPLPTAG
ncbi:MAG: glycosyltransferase family 2 protein [Actinomycetota bacterium]